MLRIVTVLLALLVPLTTTAQPATEPTPAIPEVLQPWVDWALDGHEQSLCPLRNGSGERRCTWPSRLHLDLNRDGGVFSQEWHVDAPSWVMLPGDDRAWPLDVTANGIDTVVVARSGRAAVFLGSGRHIVRGSLRWDTLPQSLAVPEDTGLLAISVDGKEIRFPERTSGGRVWLQQRSVAEARNHVGIRVFRHVLDDIPLRMTTRVELEVSGASREELLGRPLAEGFVPMMVESVLPVRIDADGRLRVQVRPGTWTIDLVARHTGPVTRLKLENPGGPWAEQEIWAFAARNDLRIVTVDDGIPVDPEQTGLPQEWRALPAYVLRPGDSLNFVEKQRGDADPAPDRLVLQRTWWLDFDGGGYTVHDEIEGTASRSWRLSMRPPARLGRVAVDAEDQLITTLPGTGAGIEVRQSALHIAADSRIEGQVGSIDAVGWDHDVESLGGELRLGPGWRLLHATGVDRAAPTWISSWTLFDLFVVLLVATAFARLWTRWWGCLALLALVLTYIEPEAPGATWIAVLAAEALARVLPAGRAAGLGRALWAIAFLLLLLDVVPFSVQQAREALHPALAQPQPTQQAELARAGAVDSGAWDQAAGSAEKSFDRVYFDAQPAAAPAATRYSHEADPAARVQTGPGLPTWHWQTVSLQWNGPVDATQKVDLILLSPWMNRLVNALGAVLLIALLLRVANHLRVAEKTVPLAMLVGVVLLAVAPTAQAQIPDRELIDELRSRLLRAPACAPACADIPTLLIEARDDRLVLRMRIDAAATVAVPLPGRASQWVAESIRLDDSPAPALASADGLTWIRLEPGRHEVLVEGRLPPRDEVQLHLPLRPHHVRTIAQGWTIAGVHEDGIADADVVLGRIADSAGAAPGVLEPATLPPLTELTRVFRLGLTWEVDSTIRRLTPPGTAVVPEIPLLPGESVTTPGIRVIDGKALVPLAAGESERSWRSILPLAELLRLTASDVADRTEVWQLAASPIWHVEATGIPVVHAPSPDEARLRTWRPWPGETVDLAITRPEAIAGATMTIDSSEVDVSPGLRSTDVQLSLSLRSSRGGEHAITLPRSAELQQVTLDGEAKPIRQEGRTVTLPLRPGLQHARIFWRQPQGAGARFVSPRIDLGMASVNSTITVAPPGNRWTLFTAGPGLGPTVLFWPLLAMYVLAAMILGRLPMSPLTRLRWFLLGLGLTQVPFPVVLVVVGWLLLLGWRREHIAAHWLSFNALQVVMVVATLAAMACLVFSVQRGLLGLPEMQIAGNGSSAYRLIWFQDLSDVELPRVTVFSVPLFVYRLAMLIWALWLARALLEWLRRGWESFSTGGLWRPRRPAARGGGE